MPGLKTGMDFRGLVWKRVWKIAFFGLKSGQDLENPSAHPYQEFPGVPSPPPGGSAEHFAGLRTTLQTMPEVLGRWFVRRAKQKSPQQNWNSSKMFLNFLTWLCDEREVIQPGDLKK